MSCLCNAVDVVEDVISEVIADVIDEKKFRMFVYLYVNAKYKNKDQKNRLRLNINKYIEKFNNNNISDDESVDSAREEISEQASE